MAVASGKRAHHVVRAVVPSSTGSSPHAFLYINSLRAYSFSNMPRRVTYPIGLLVVFCCLSISLPCRAQTPAVAYRCSVSAPSPKVNDAWRKVIVKHIDFDGPIHLSKSDVEQIIKELNQKTRLLNADDPEWINWFTEQSLKDAWLTHGYFKVNATAQAHSLGGNSSEERFLVTAHVEEGLQYHLRNIRFVGDSTFPETELRAAIPMRDGEIFNVGLIRTGINALTELYGSKGFIDFTVVPDTDTDDDQRPSIALVLNLDPQKQYHVGNVDIAGLDPKLEARLRAIVRPGEIYLPFAVAGFFKQNKSELPSGLNPWRAMHVHLNGKDGIIDMVFEFRVCP
jgi:hypothetical protein